MSDAKVILGLWTTETKASEMGVMRASINFKKDKRLVVELIDAGENRYRMEGSYEFKDNNFLQMQASNAQGKDGINWLAKYKITHDLLILEIEGEAYNLTREGSERGHEGVKIKEKGAFRNSCKKGVRKRAQFGSRNAKVGDFRGELKPWKQGI